ncbi:MAG: Kelch repeat-containing protein [Planctomycetota bacterium]|jgi:N-acetylneuraminic acid mutarotase
MKKTISLVLVLALGLASVSMAAEGIWTRKADMPTARSCSTTAVNGKIYAIGGNRNAYSAALSTVEEYDPETNEWTTKSNMPTARMAHGACVVEGKIYVIGGGRSASGSGLSTVEEYDPVSDTWRTKSDMPTARLVLSASVVNGKIYAIGGKPVHGVSPLSTVEEYDPETDTWTTKADMPTARFGLSTCAVNGKIYAIGGDPGNSDATYIGLPTIEEYDPVMDTWTRKSDMPTARGYLSTSAVNGKIYAIGGGLRLVRTYGLSTVEEYDPVTDTWITKADMPTRRFFLVSSVVNNKIYVIGGAVGPHPWPACPTVEEYDPNPLVVDFNANGIVDCADMCMMVENWHTDNSFYDIAPRPFGDGIVDVQDLILLSEHLFEEAYDPTLVAYWALDETEGDIAYDSVAVNDAVVFGGALWQPAGGQVDGALAFDGTDDYVSTPFVVDPAAGAFSVFAWIKGGAPGQVILSQIGQANWLLADPSKSNLMTGLEGIGRSGCALMSQTLITDGAWHRVGLTAQDTQNQPVGSTEGLYIGADKDLSSASFFSGLIDDVRIYDRAVTP